MQYILDGGWLILIGEYVYTQSLTVAQVEEMWGSTRIEWNRAELKDDDRIHFVNQWDTDDECGKSNFWTMRLFTPEPNESGSCWRDILEYIDEESVETLSSKWKGAEIP